MSRAPETGAHVPPPDTPARRAAAFVAIATFAAARDVAEAIDARRRGEHPSEMRGEADLRRDLGRTAEACARGWRHLVRRLFGFAADGEDEPVLNGTHDAAVVADTLLTAQRLARDLHRLHQHLLGLAAVGADVAPVLAEDARRFAAAVDAIGEGDALPSGADLVALDGHWQALGRGLPTTVEGAE